MNIREIDRLRETYRNWMDSAIMRGKIKRQPQWTGSIAVGDKVYVEKVKDLMGYKAIGRCPTPMRLKGLIQTVFSSALWFLGVRV